MKKVLFVGSKFREESGGGSLGAKGMVIHMASGTNEALLFLINGKYDLVICDLDSSGRNNLQFLQLIRNWKNDTPLIIAKATEEAISSQQPVDLKVEYVIPSPANEEEVMQVAKDYFEANLQPTS